MKKVNLPYLCKTLSSLSGIPARVFQGEEQVCYASVVRLPRDPMALYRREIWALEGPVGYYITPRFYLYGVVHWGDLRLVVGPTAQIAAQEQTLRELAFRCDVPKEEVTAFVEGMKAIVPMPLESLLMMLCPVNYTLTGEELELRDILIREAEQETIKKQVESTRTRKVYETDAPRPPHNTLALEETMLNIVRKGDSAALRQWVGSAPAIRGGVLAADQLRQLRNTLIVTATLVSRAAIRGGMDAEDALSLSDAYIRRCETLTTQEQITNLQYNMVLEFTEQVEKIRRHRSPTKLQIEVANYVQHHLSEPISTEAMARELYLSRTHFSARFKAETGMTLTDFILNEKTEEAKRLLRYSDKSLAAISAYLGFSSHGHFSRVFKKYAGLTPNEYREKHAR
ncbi:MAG: helix-turn-helix domain-containing protein [Oscillospiraceae bacterium]|nr:helix-turn-helix domain-containing protein [Oscillospiraceae bacterium]